MMDLVRSKLKADSITQYKIEERSTISRRLIISDERMKLLIDIMKEDTVSIKENVVNLRKEIFKYIRSYNESWEEDTLPRIVMDNQAMAYTHNGFFGSMDSLRDKNQLNNLWNSNLAKWKMWK